MRQDAVTRDRRYGPLMAKRSEGRKEGRKEGSLAAKDATNNAHWCGFLVLSNCCGRALRQRL